MKSHVAVVTISLAFLFAIFIPCHGIRCYFCTSQNYGTKSCENITSNEFAHDYGDDVENCLRMIAYRNHSGEESRQLYRFGFSDSGRRDFDNMKKAYLIRRYTVDYMVCTDDLCNGD